MRIPRLTRLETCIPDLTFDILAYAEMTDIVKFNTFYTFEGSGAEVQEFWEKMTKVRLEFFEEPGPVGTAVRCSGFMLDDILIEVEAIAVIPRRK